MAVREVDTSRIKELSQDMLLLANEYDVEINKLFKRLSEVPYVTKEWVGNQAEKYFKIIMLDKNEFLDFGNELKRYAKKISEDSDRLEEAIKKTQLDEAKEK